MGKISAADKMRMQTLHEQSLGAKAIFKTYLKSKQWKLSSVKAVC